MASFVALRDQLREELAGPSGEPRDAGDPPRLASAPAAAPVVSGGGN
jgi:hypothetical protein